MSHPRRRRPARLKIALAATASVAVLELAGGLRAGSLALISDAAHVTMDVVALAIALAAAVQAKRPATHRQTYGFARYEILAALANGALLDRRHGADRDRGGEAAAAPELSRPAALMAAVAAIGLAVNVAVGAGCSRGRPSRPQRARRAAARRGRRARRARRDRGRRADPVHRRGLDRSGALAGRRGVILIGIVRIVREATDVLLESAPDHAAVPDVRDRIGSVPGVVGVHDLHVWTIGSGSHALSAHVVLDDRKLSEAGTILRSIDGAMRGRLRDRSRHGPVRVRELRRGHHHRVHASDSGTPATVTKS